MPIAIPKAAAFGSVVVLVYLAAVEIGREVLTLRTRSSGR
jgi:hypothetical protein